MSNGIVHYATAAIADAATEIGRVAAQTEANHQQSLQIVRANAENFGGQGSQAFNEAINAVNHQYAQQQDAISRAGLALAQANESQTQADVLSAGQYH
jgi:hypothetical protein